MKNSWVQRCCVRFQGQDRLNSRLLKFIILLSESYGVGQFYYSKVSGLRDVKMIEFSSQISNRVQHYLNQINTIQIHRLIILQIKVVIMNIKGTGNKNGTQMLRPQLKTKQKQQKKQQKKQEQYVMPRKGGIKIGEDNHNGKWQCKTCKRYNGLQLQLCHFCEDPRVISTGPSLKKTQK